MSLERFPRFTLLDGPTPLQRLPALSTKLNINLFVKRDDMLGLGGGGNKLRKLEFLLGDALRSGADTLIAVGGVQSNFARLLAAAACKAGVQCELVLSHMVPRDDADYLQNGNTILNRLFGARTHDLPASVDAVAYANARAAELEREGRSVYVCPLGGSSAVGCLGYVAGAIEIELQRAEQGLRFDHILLPNGSGGTQVGLLAGAILQGQAVDTISSYNVLAPVEKTIEQTEVKLRETLDLLGLSTDSAEGSVKVRDGYRGNGYGVPTESMRDALSLMATTEGLLLDPVYGGKAFAGLLGDVRSGWIAPGSNVLFVMTGGLPSLFAYRDALT
ncbi:MAG TPA: D-cysteine desulfhydrase family protein [Luteibacter sp.]|jgi:L-cysteate sulfo-lyase|nr:D-cysteine desulfhydrase family protein [Luteibacter sp.]